MLTARAVCLAVLYASVAAVDLVFPVPGGKVLGVNLGNWLLYEVRFGSIRVADPAAMDGSSGTRSPFTRADLQEWKSMGGADCGSCQACSPSSEFDLVKLIGQDKADAAFKTHWQTWFTQADVDTMKANGLNHVRIPIGAWIIESLVNRQTEYYPRGGYAELKRGLKMIKAAGLTAVIDFHAMLGVSAADNMFAGRCANGSDVSFFDNGPHMARAYQLAALFTTLAYLDPDYATVFGIFALNEPLIAGHADNYRIYQQQFIRVVRATEYALGVQCDWPKFSLSKVFDSTPPALGTSLSAMATSALFKDDNLRSSLSSADKLISTFLSEQGLRDPWQKRRLRRRSRWARTKRELRRYLPRHVFKPRATADDPDCDDGVGGSSIGSQVPLGLPGKTPVGPTASPPDRGACLTIGMMHQSWENNSGPNPDDAANGPQYSEVHPYPYFGGLPNDQNVYLQTGCGGMAASQKPQNNAAGAAAGGIPVIAGEWWLATKMGEGGTTAPPDSFYQKFGDGQKSVFVNRGDGWVFWSFKIETSSVHLPTSAMQGDATRDYALAVKSGLLPKNASQITDTGVCPA